MPTAPRLANIHHGAPAKNNTAMNTIVSATVVPRSGCSMISTTISPNTGNTGISSALGEPSVDRRAASTCAIHSNRASLAISLGWNCRPPNRQELRRAEADQPDRRVGGLVGEHRERRPDRAEGGDGGRGQHHQQAEAEHQREDPED